MEQGNVFRPQNQNNQTQEERVSIPLEQGNVFRLQFPGNWVNLIVSIPLEQGNVFRQLLNDLLMPEVIGLNPFGTGQCLSTLALLKVFR